jgi:hypothetical protein
MGKSMSRRELTDENIDKMLDAQEKGMVLWSQPLAEDICMKIATSALGLKKLCDQNPHWPELSIIYLWRVRSPKFREMYDTAKKMQMEALMDDTLEIADDKSNDTKIRYDNNGDAIEVTNHEWIARSKMRIYARQYMAARLDPARWGEKQQNNTTITIKHEDAIKQLS